MAPEPATRHRRLCHYPAVAARLSLVCCCATALAPLSLPADVTLHVSPRGDDASRGTQSRPFKTIQRAQQEVRRTIAPGMTEDAIVLIHGGTYYLDGALTFDERDSGRDGHRVVYRAPSGEDAQVIGGKPITDWRPAGEGIYAARLEAGWRPDVLTENGELATVARTPNEGYLSVAAVPEPVEAGKLVYRPGDLPDRFGYPDAQVLVWAGYHEEWDGGKNYNWEASLCPVSHVDFGTQTVTLQGQTIRRLHQHNRYYVRGAREFLDRPGEFCLDRGDGVLYYSPMAEPIEDQLIVGSTTPHVLELAGSSPEQPIRDIAFEGLTLSQSSSLEIFGPPNYLMCDGLVYVRNARNITVRHCRIRNAGLAAIALDKCSRGHTIYGNLIEDAAHSGICAAGYWIGNAPFGSESDAYVNRDHRISNNHIRRCGRLIGQASGVWLYQSGDNEISHNLIEEMPRYGIRLIGTSYSGMVTSRERRGLGGELFGKPITFDNHLDFIYTRNNRVVSNEITRCMQDSQDGGGICTYATGAGNLIAGNLVHHLRTAVTEGSVAGVYLDDASNRFTVRDNIVACIAGCKYVYPLIVKGYDNIVANNIIADNDARAAIYILQTPHGGLPEDEGHDEELVDRLTFTHNILYRSGGLVYQIYPWKDTIVGQSDDNVIYDPAAGYGCTVDWKWEKWEDWTQRLGGKYDRRTRLTDPLFSDPDNMIYTLAEGSPALALGFRPIDASAIGLLPDFRPRDGP